MEPFTERSCHLNAAHNRPALECISLNLKAGEQQEQFNDR